VLTLIIAVKKTYFGFLTVKTKKVVPIEIGGRVMFEYRKPNDCDEYSIGDGPNCYIESITTEADGKIYINVRCQVHETVSDSYISSVEVSTIINAYLKTYRKDRHLAIKESIAMLRIN
jgi:hypothetical protein